MSTRSSVYFGKDLHVWSEAVQGPMYGLLMSGYQTKDDECDTQEFERVKIPFEACEAIAEWVAKVHAAQRKP